MRNRFFAFICAMAVCLSMNAQKSSSRFIITPHVGFNLAKLYGADIYGTSENGLDKAMPSRNKTGIVAGVEAEAKINAPLGISLGAFYANQGTSNKGYTYEDKTHREEWLHVGTTRHVVQFPLMLNMHTLEGFTFKAGLQVNLTAGASNYFDLAEYLYDEDGTMIKYIPTKENHDSMDAMKKVTMSIPVGVSYEYENVVLDLRYEFPLSNSSALGINERQHALILTAGYSIKL